MQQMITKKQKNLLKNEIAKINFSFLKITIKFWIINWLKQAKTFVYCPAPSKRWKTVVT